jgi:hypothetical protein
MEDIDVLGRWACIASLVAFLSLIVNFSIVINHFDKLSTETKEERMTKNDPTGAKDYHRMVAERYWKDKIEQFV